MNVMHVEASKISYTNIEMHVTKIIIKHHYKDTTSSNNILYDLFEYEKCLKDLSVFFDANRIEKIKEYMSVNCKFIDDSIKSKKKQNNTDQLSLF